jgi:quinol monooxygenase YgiN
MVFAIMRLFPSSRERVHLLEILRSVQDLTVVQPGCVGCWLDEQESPRPHVLYGEQWASEEELHNHIRSDRYRRIVASLELSSQRPEVSFHYTTKVKGIELIEEVRNQAQHELKGL